MEKKKNLCAMIPETLHRKAREEQEKQELTLSQYVEQVLKEHFERGGKEMEGKLKTLAFQVSEELFGRIKEHLKKTGLSQKDFVIGLIEQALDEAETGETGQTSGAEEAGETEEASEMEQREKPQETDEMEQEEETL